jgi:ABC-type enterochelin transport system substrate-binding protein
LRHWTVSQDEASAFTPESRTTFLHRQVTVIWKWY